MSEASVQIELLSELSDANATELETLLGQLSTAAFDRSRIAAMLDHDGIELFVARDGRRIVGMATLVTVPLPTGWRGHVEDVVVDATMRGRGVARLLIERLTSVASERGLRTLDLTSRPSRESALRLYEDVGIVRRDTNVLRFTPRSIDKTTSR
ncbi:GNAT family N-acetyltransferase [Agromyces sp. Marseille-Q5079]|uniref:GNAT family N-acetyltransferase n=1 Tax=Agromyces sp. Marseille-Q5079 TaxID=3439059 RepID=UPI003D9C9415